MIENRLNKQDILNLQEVYKIEPQESMFGLINSFTRYGREIELNNQDNERKVMIEDITGKLLERV